LEMQERKIDGLDFFKIHFHFCVCVCVNVTTDWSRQIKTNTTNNICLLCLYSNKFAFV
jgi:hypothetical protein